MPKKNSPNGEETAKAAEKKEAAQPQQSDATNTVTQEINSTEFDIGHLPDSLSGLTELIVKTEEEIRDLDLRITEIISKLKPQPKIKQVTSKTKIKRSPGTSVQRKALKLELQELKDSRFYKREQVERAKDKYDSLFTRTQRSIAAKRQKAKGASTFYIKRNMPRIANSAFIVIKELSVKEKLKLAAIKKIAKTDKPEIIYTPLTELIRKYSPETVDLLTGSDTVKAPIYDKINDALIDWNEVNELDILSEAKNVKRRTKKKISNPDNSEQEVQVEELKKGNSVKTKK